jgi:hypothetical protein
MKKLDIKKSNDESKEQTIKKEKGKANAIPVRGRAGS